MSNGATQGKHRLSTGVGRGQTAGRNFTHPNTQKTSHNSSQSKDLKAASYVLATSDSSSDCHMCVPTY